MMKSWLSTVLLGLLCFTAGMQEVRAEDNELMEMTVSMELLENGTGIITEERRVDLESGTELYIVLNEEDGLELLDFKVIGLLEEEEWDSDLSREEKAGRYGVIETRDGAELVWGIEEYGEQSYTLTYAVANVVRQLNDGQALFWDFNTFGELEPENLSIEIRGPEPFTTEDTSLYGFGYVGGVELENGVLRSYSEDGVEAERPVSILMQFVNEPFIPSYYEDQTLAEQLERAEAETGRGGEEDFDSSLLIGLFGALAAGFGAFIFMLFKIDARKKEQGKIPTAGEQRRRNKGLMYTAIPYKNGEITDIAYFLQQLQKGTYEQYIFAYLLKWTKNKLVSIDTVEDAKGKIEKTVLTFSPAAFRKKRENSLNVSDFEQELWDLFQNASGADHQLTSEDMTEWAEKNGKELQKLQKRLLDESEAVLIKEGYLIQKTLNFMKMKLPFMSVTKKGQKLFDQLTQFENHINALKKDPSLSYRQLMDKKDFLIWASLYGKEEDVIEQLEEVVPQWSSQNVEGLPYFYSGYYGLHIMSTSMHTGLSNGGYTQTGGTGGPTSIGGGGGAIGGGGGGVR